MIRFIHEKAFGVMFHFGDLAQHDRQSAIKLEASLPFELSIYDVGGGLAPQRLAASGVRPEEIASTPMTFFLKGLLDPRIRWDLPRPLSTSGFLSVVGESLSGLPPESQAIGRTSYAIISDRYMNFSTKAGYHFSTVDTYCGKSINKNYIHFRFSGGGASRERRDRRVRFLILVLDQLDFKTQQRGDALVARLEKYDREVLHARLVRLGLLTLVTRQLDMLMDSETSPEFFAQAFLKDEMKTF